MNTKSFYLGAAVGFLLGGFVVINFMVDRGIHVAAIRRQTIANGCARYNPTNANFEMLGHKNP